MTIPKPRGARARAIGGAGEISRKAESLAGQAYRQIEDLIVRLEFQPGLAMSEADLSARLGIGRTPIREALQRLEREGLILIAPRRGLFVSEIRIDAQLRLIEVRRALERLITSRAARSADAGERETFARIATEMRSSGSADDDIGFLKLDQEYNLLVSTVAGNEFASAAIALTAGLSRRFWFRYYRTTADLPLTSNLHAEVAEAIASADPDAAAAASDRLIDYIELFTRKVFKTLT